jgi:triosephosphate isomerase
LPISFTLPTFAHPKTCIGKREGLTGEINAAMLEALQVKHVVIGHRERREWFGESDAMVAKKVAAVLQVGLNPILYIGETLAERDGNRVEEEL